MAPSVAASPTQPHESSSAMIAAVTASTPPPPCSRGTAYDVSPSAAAFGSSPSGNMSDLSHSPAIGRSSRSANSCASACSSRCSSVSVNAITQNVNSSMPPEMFSSTPVM